MEFKLLSNKEAKQLIDSIELSKYKFNDFAKGYSDFRFLLDIDFEYESNKFIFAYGNNNLYGVIKLVDTKYKNKNILGLSFIDVNRNFKNQGIGKELIKYFDSVNMSNVLLSSKPCEEGKKYKIDEVIKSITNKKVIFV